ncbi:nitrate reductase subunit beta [Streptomyces alboniger]|nr:nitrate reductase subunit beta [Streptomyces alboniger]
MPRDQAPRRRVMAQIAMVMNLDKCIGCHTCSVTCKQAWTNRDGMEYVWFNNVETRPGQGYPRRYEDQEKWRGGWELNRRGALKLKNGGRIKSLLEIFSNPKLPEIKDYYEPWTYEYRNLTDAPLGDDYPVAEPRSLISGKPMKIEWSSNWDDNLGGATEHGHLDPMVAKTRQQAADKVKFAFEQTFMFYLPRICEHCLNPACVASCPSGAMYKREEDGIVLVDQDHCRGWRKCVTGCPYKKVYFNHRTGKAEKCTMCYPRVEVGLPTVCSETCVGRLRYLGVILYDPDKVTAAASEPDEHKLYQAQLDAFLDPEDPEVRRDAERSGITYDWIEAARRSPVHALISTYRVALPLHPEYRTMPMVWYIPPLSPVVDALTETGHDGEDATNLFGAIDTLRIPLEYLAEIFTAGDVGPVRASLEKLAAMRAHMRAINLGDAPDSSVARSVGMSGREVEEMYRLLAIAKYEDRYVIPTAAVGDARRLEESALPELSDSCSLDFEGGPGMGGDGPFGQDSGRKQLPLVTIENFHALRDRQSADREPRATEKAHAAEEDDQ